VPWLWHYWLGGDALPAAMPVRVRVLAVFRWSVSAFRLPVDTVSVRSSRSAWLPVHFLVVSIAEIAVVSYILSVVVSVCIPVSTTAVEVAAWL
jgi:hypothetical protein